MKLTSQGKCPILQRASRTVGEPEVTSPGELKGRFGPDIFTDFDYEDWNFNKLCIETLNTPQRHYPRRSERGDELLVGDAQRKGALHRAKLHGLQQRLGLSIESPGRPPPPVFRGMRCSARRARCIWYGDSQAVGNHEDRAPWPIAMKDRQ